MGYESEDRRKGVKELNLEMGARRGFPYLSFQKVLKISSKIIFISV